MKAAVALASVAALLLSACANINPTEDYPVVSKTFGPNKKDDVGEAIAITASRRVVIVLLKPPGLEAPHYCAEPPPDVSPVLIEAFKASVKAEGQSDANKKASASGEVERTSSALAEQLFKRHQGVQWFRDGLYSLCQLSLNGFIDQKSTDIRLGKLIEESAKLIEAEIKANAKK